MKYKSASGNKKQVLKDLGGGAYWAVGGKNIPVFGMVVSLMGFLVEVGSVGPRLYFRKHIGLRSAHMFPILVHISLVYGLLLQLSRGRSFLSFFLTDTGWDSATYIAWYIAGLLIVILLHFFEALILDRNIVRHSYHRGYGVLSMFWGQGDDTNKYLRLVDPLFIGIAALFFFSIRGGDILGLILITGAVCILLEDLLIFYRSWEAKKDIDDLTIEAEAHTSSTPVSSDAPKPSTIFKGRSATKP